VEVVLIHTGFVGFWKRVLAYLIQVSILCIPSVYAYRYLIVQSSKTGSLMPFVIYWIFYFAFSVFLMVKKRAIHDFLAGSYIVTKFIPY
jgi:uncharacterized RDD family membrane protein YckC